MLQVCTVMYLQTRQADCKEAQGGDSAFRTINLQETQSPSVRTGAQEERSAYVACPDLIAFRPQR